MSTVNTSVPEWVIEVRKQIQQLSNKIDEAINTELEANEFDSLDSGGRRWARYYLLKKYGKNLALHSISSYANSGKIEVIREDAGTGAKKKIVFTAALLDKAIENNFKPESDRIRKRIREEINE